MQEYFPNKRQLWVFIGILLLSFLVRIVGFNWGGQGTTFHPDEEKVYKAAMIMARNVSYFSESNVYPAQFSQKILACIYWVYFRISENRSEVVCIYLARVLSVIFGTITVVVSFFVSERIKKESGIYTSFLLAFCGPLVAQSHVAVMDAEVGCFTALAMLVAICYCETFEKKKEYRWLITLSALCSIAAMEKYYGAFLCFLTAGVVISKNANKKNYKNIVVQGATSFLVFLVGMFVIAPNLFIYYKKTWDGIVHVTSDYYSDISYFGSLLRTASWYFSYVGIASLFFLVFAVRYFVVNRTKVALVLLTGIVQPLFMATSKQGTHIRWVQPMFICVLIAVGIGISLVAERINNQKNVIELILIIVCFLNVFANGFLCMSLYGANYADNSNVCESYLLNNNIAPQNCLYDRYTCLRTGGVSKYYDSVNVKDSYLYIDDEQYVNKLGRDYALSLGIVESSNTIKTFRVDYPVNKSTNDKYSSPSFRWIDLYSIVDSFWYGIGFWSGTKTSGYDYSLEDITKIKGIQTFEINETGEYPLSAINEGEYEVSQIEGNADGFKMAIIKSGNELLEEKQISMKDHFIIDKDWIDLQLVVTLTDENPIVIQIKEL